MTKNSRRHFSNPDALYDELGVVMECVEAGEAWAPWSEWAACECDKTDRRAYQTRSRGCLDEANLKCEKGNDSERKACSSSQSKTCQTTTVGISRML